MAGHAPSAAGVPSTMAAAGGAAHTVRTAHSNTTTVLVRFISAPLSRRYVNCAVLQIAPRSGRVESDDRELGSCRVDHYGEAPHVRNVRRRDPQCRSKVLGL